MRGGSEGVRYGPPPRALPLLYIPGVIITINVPVVYMERDDMISMRANPYLGPCEGVGSGNLDFFGPKMALASLVAI